jgi:hypothetical protein
LGIAWFFRFFFETFFEIAQSLQAMAFVFVDPTPIDLVDRDGIEIVELLASVPDDDDEVCFFQDNEMLGHCLTGHVEQLRQPAE